VKLVAISSEGKTKALEHPLVNGQRWFDACPDGLVRIEAPGDRKVVFYVGSAEDERQSREES
jgi:hypothetical protein